MIPCDEIKLLFETFAYHEHNTQNEDLDRCKAGNKYFFDNKTSLQITCEMILKMQTVMYRSLPKTSAESYNMQCDRMNRIVKECKNNLTELETIKNEIDEKDINQ